MLKSSKQKKIKFPPRKNFAFLLSVLVLVYIVAPPDPFKWVGMALCMFSTIANDSIQTIGTFLSSNRGVPWWKLWLYISILFVITALCSWFMYAGRLDFGQLKSIPYTQKHTLLHFLAPATLILLTYNKIPCSSTFLLMSIFASQRTIGSMLTKTILGYIMGITTSFLLWEYLVKVYGKNLFLFEENGNFWRNVQWASSGLLFISWLTSGISNLVIFLPRVFNVYNLVLLLMLGLTMLAFTIYNRGGPIEEIVSHKSGMDNLKITSITNILYAVILLGVIHSSKVPMSTSWVFIGILAGQEMAFIALKGGKKLTLKEKYKAASKSLIRDFVLASLGILMSLIFALVNGIYYG